VILTRRTVEIIKNFSQINPTGMVWPEGDIIAIEPPGIATMLAVAQLDETNNERFAIIDLVQFFSAISSFEKPELELSNRQIVISDAGQAERGNFKLNTASEQVIKAPQGMKFPEEDTVSFMFDQQMVNRLFKGISIVQAPKIIIKGDGGNMYAMGYDPDNSGMGQYQIPLSETAAEFTYVFEVDHLNKLMKATDYQVSISPRGIARFKGDRLSYYIASKTMGTT
jgi:hypothetical protein